MALNRIILWLGNSLVLIAVLMALTAMAGVMLGEWEEATLFALLVLSVGLVGVIFVAMTRGSPGRESNAEALLFLLMFWVTMPVILALPYWFLGQVEHPETAYFEATSALTTTGASTLDPDTIPGSLHIWRSSVQWMGGVISATFAVVILAALNLRGTGVHRSMLFTLKKGELFGRLIGIGRVIAGVYALISAVTAICLMWSGTPPFEAVCLALTSVSTGGLTPRGEVLAGYISHIGLLALMLSCVLGGMNVALVWDFFRLRNWRSLKLLGQNPEHRALFVVIAVLAMLGLFFTGLSHMGTVGVEAVFFATSTGYDYHVIGLDMVPPVVLIAAALIGGSALSTAGGVKLIRLLLLFRHLETDMSRLSHPSRIVPVVFRGQILPDQAFLSIWMYFFGYTIVFALGILGLGALGMEYTMATAASAASLSNMGPMLDATLPPYSYAAFTLPQQALCSALMLVGRVEVLAAIALFSPSLWRA